MNNTVSGCFYNHNQAGVYLQASKSTTYQPPAIVQSRYPVAVGGHVLPQVGIRMNQSNMCGSRVSMFDAGR